MVAEAFDKVSANELKKNLPGGDFVEFWDLTDYTRNQL
jgi:hypothetical protein